MNLQLPALFFLLFTFEDTKKEWGRHQRLLDYCVRNYSGHVGDNERVPE